MNPTEHYTHRLSARRSHAGYVMAEVILAFSVFGIALAGLFPFVVGQIRLTTKLETRFQGEVYFYKDVASRIREDVDGRVKIYPTTSDNGNPNRYPAVTHQADTWNNPRMSSLLGGAVITTDPPILGDDLTPYQLNSAVIRHGDFHSTDPTKSIDDYSLPSSPSAKYDIIIYNYDIVYNNSASDPTIIVDLDQEPK